MRLCKHGEVLYCLNVISARLFVDSAYLSSAACEVLQPTAWIPLIDANKINGCMQVIALSILRLTNPSYPSAEFCKNCKDISLCRDLVFLLKEKQLRRESLSPLRNVIPYFLFPGYLGQSGIQYSC